jgi:polyhydroxyalkanoate synthesis regulator phasin
MDEERQGEGEFRLEEAERLLDSLLERARSFTTRTAALAREEVEDMVAEAKELKQREHA